jgi:glutamate synthase (NADPH/NADH) small chain
VHRIDYGHAEARQHSVLAGGFDYLCEPFLFFSLVDPAQATARFGADPRAYGLAVKEFLGTEEGRVRAVVTQSVDWAAPRGAEGQLPTVAGTEKMWPADVVLLAMGFASPQHSPLVKQLAVPLDERGNFRAGWGDFSAGMDWVFAAGDCRRGQSLVVWAIKEGRRAAECCHAYLLQKQGHAENFG